MNTVNISSKLRDYDQYNSAEQALLEMKEFLSEIKKENPRDWDVAFRALTKILEIRKMSNDVSFLSEFQQWYQNEIKNFIFQNFIISEKNQRLIEEKMLAECRKMEFGVKQAIILKQVENIFKKIKNPQV